MSLDGLILVHKPQKLTSHDVVARIRRVLNQKKVGHFGTLDPLATGLLVVAAGKATRLFQFFSKCDKVYQGRIRLGFATETFDAWGEPTSPKTRSFPHKQDVLGAMHKLTGELQQLPPPYSAKKFKGRPFYLLARTAGEIPLRPSRVMVHFFQLKDYSPPYLDFSVKCSSGTYVRSLAHDLGKTLGCGAHISKLKRTEFGNFYLKESFRLNQIEARAKKNRWEDFIIPLEKLLCEYPRVILDQKGLTEARSGNMISIENIVEILPGKQPQPETGKQGLFRLFNSEGKLVALARGVPDRKGLHPFFVIDSSQDQR